MSRKLSHDFKLAARTAPELHEAISLFVLRAQSAGVKFQGRKVGAEAIINALLIDFLDRPDEERMELLRSNVARFEQVMQSDEPVPAAAIPGRPTRPAYNAIGGPEREPGRRARKPG